MQRVHKIPAILALFAAVLTSIFVLEVPLPTDMMNVYESFGSRMAKIDFLTWKMSLIILAAFFYSVFRFETFHKDLPRNLLIGFLVYFVGGLF